MTDNGKKQDTTVDLPDFTNDDGVEVIDLSHIVSKLSSNNLQPLPELTPDEMIDACQKRMVRGWKNLLMEQTFPASQWPKEMTYERFIKERTGYYAAKDREEEFQGFYRFDEFGDVEVANVPNVAALIGHQFEMLLDETPDKYPRMEEC